MSGPALGVATYRPEGQELFWWGRGGHWGQSRRAGGEGDGGLQQRRVDGWAWSPEGGPVCGSRQRCRQRVTPVGSWEPGFLKKEKQKKTTVVLDDQKSGCPPGQLPHGAPPWLTWLHVGCIPCSPVQAAR